jgi:hypothetical protein
MAYDTNVLRGEVKAIIKPTVPGGAEKVQISIQTGGTESGSSYREHFDQFTGRTCRSEKGCSPSRRHPA